MVRSVTLYGAAGGEISVERLQEGRYTRLTHVLVSGDKSSGDRFKTACPAGGPRMTSQSTELCWLLTPSHVFVFHMELFYFNID